MRGNEFTLSRLPAARAFIAGAAILAGAAPAGVAHAAGGYDDTAFANPRVAPVQIPGGGLGGAGLPMPLSPSDAGRLKHVFDLQAAADVAQAELVLQGVSDPLLNGHVLAQRYLLRTVQPSLSDLATWLARYPDHPDAGAIHAALMARLTPGAQHPPTPDLPILPPETPAAQTPEEADPPRVRLNRNPLLDRTVHERAHAGNADSALHLLSQTKGLDSVYGGQLRAEIARALFTQGRDADALKIAQGALRQSGGRIGLAGFIGGLAAWRMDRPADALPLFEAASHADIASESLLAAAQFWTARAHLRNRDPAGYRPWMRRAAQSQHTFYGILARRILGMGLVPVDRQETLGQADGDALMANPHGRRALALLQTGQMRRAEDELRCLWPTVADNQALAGAVLRVAEAGGLMDLAAQLAGLIDTADGVPHDDARFPTPPLRPAGGFRMDPALVYALTRLESNFDPDAVSNMGARGLMQLMPVTASYVSGNGGAQAGRYAQRLFDPATNLSLGQSYVLYLSNMDGVQGDLIRLLASYNAGPTSFARMASTIPVSDDPLLFIESIPNDETRGFIPRALTYSWIYAARLRLPAASLDQMAAGAWPRFQPPASGHEPPPRLH